VVNGIGDGKVVAVHCRAGIGRSSLIAASVLVYLRAARARAFELIGQARRERSGHRCSARMVTAFCRSDFR
jgi:protein-tyrosine phosphatase